MLRSEKPRYHLSPAVSAMRIVSSRSSFVFSVLNPGGSGRILFSPLKKAVSPCCALNARAAPFLNFSSKVYISHLTSRASKVNCLYIINYSDACFFVIVRAVCGILFLCPRLFFLYNTMFKRISQPRFIHGSYKFSLL